MRHQTQVALVQSGHPRRALWHDSRHILALQQFSAESGEYRITLLQADQAQQHYNLVVKDRTVVEAGSLSPSWSPSGYPPVLLLPTKAGHLNIFTRASTPAQSSKGCLWQGQTIARVGLDLVTAIFLTPLSTWMRSPPSTSQQDDKPASNATGTKLAGFHPVQPARLHWVRHSSLCGAAVSSNGLIQVFWRSLAAGSSTAWHTSKPVPLNCSGTVTQAIISTCPQGLHVALQTAEEPGRLALIHVTGNPTAVSDTGEALQALQSSSPCMVGVSEGCRILDFSFQPMSSGEGLLVLSHSAQAAAVTLTCYRCKTPAKSDEQQQQQKNMEQENEQEAAPRVWSEEASYSAPSDFSEHLHSARQILSSADGILTGLITFKPDQPQTELHLLHTSTLSLASRRQLPPGCTAAAISPSSCCLASIHPSSTSTWSDPHQQMPQQQHLLPLAPVTANAEAGGGVVGQDEQINGMSAGQVVAKSEVGGATVRQNGQTNGVSTGQATAVASDTTAKHDRRAVHKRKLEESQDGGRTVSVRFSSLPKEALSGPMQVESASAAQDQATSTPVGNCVAGPVAEAEQQKQLRGRARPKALIAALVQRWLWSVLKQASPWDILQAAQAQCAEEGASWLSTLLLAMDNAVHAEPHQSRGHLANALDLFKLALLQGVPDATAQAVRQDLWLRRHVLALDTVVASYCSTQELASKTFAPDKLHVDDQRLLQQWLAKADDLTTFMLHSIASWVQKHEQSGGAGDKAGVLEADAVPGVRLLADDQTLKRLAKALMVYSIVVQSSGRQPTSGQMLQQQQQRLAPFSEQAMLRVKQLLTMLQVVSQKARAAAGQSEGAAGKPGPDSLAGSSQLAADAADSFQGAFHLHYTRASGAVSWQALQHALPQQALPSFQGQNEAQPSQILQSMAQKLGLNQPLTSAPALGLPVQEVNSTMLLLPPDLTSSLISAPRDSLAASLFSPRNSRHAGQSRQWQADHQAAKQPITLPGRSERRDAVSSTPLAWFETASQTCQNGCCATNELQQAISAKVDASLVSQAIKSKWIVACPLTGAPWQSPVPCAVHVG